MTKMLRTPEELHLGILGKSEQAMAYSCIVIMENNEFKIVRKEKFLKIKKKQLILVYNYVTYSCNENI